MIKKPKQNRDYGPEIQKVYLEMMISDAETFLRCQSIFDSSLFHASLTKPAEFINEYVTQYNVMPTEEMIYSSTGTALKIHKDLKENHYEWLLDEFEIFTRHKSIERAILDSSELLDQGEYGPVEKLIKEATQIGLQKDLGTDYFESPRERLMKIKDKNGQTSTGWPSLDRKLFGGMNRGELNIFAGGSGAGKSLFLANLGVNWSLAGLNVLYITLELSEELVSLRLDSMMTDTPSRDVFKEIEDVELKVKMIGKKSGSLQVKYMPSGKTANDVRGYVKELELKTGRKLDVVLLDYLDLLMPISVKISPENLFIKDKYVSEELRNLAVELDTLFVTASQLNRSATQEVEFDHSHISGGISKIQTADNLFGIFTSRAMRESGRYQIQLMKTRSSSGVGQTVELQFDINTLRITDDDSDEDSAPENSLNTKSSSAILDKIKRSTTIEEPKINAEASSLQIRQFLNDLGDDE